VNRANAVFGTPKGREGELFRGVSIQGGGGRSLGEFPLDAVSLGVLCLRQETGLRRKFLKGKGEGGAT